MGGNFREKLEEAPRIKFLNFVACDDVVNFELEHVERILVSQRVLRERLVSQAS